MRPIRSKITRALKGQLHRPIFVIELHNKENTKNVYVDYIPWSQTFCVAFSKFVIRHNQYAVKRDVDYTYLSNDMLKDIRKFLDL